MSNLNRMSDTISKKILEPFGKFEGLMCKFSMIRNTNDHAG